jgi:hypothetical protein
VNQADSTLTHGNSRSRKSQGRWKLFAVILVCASPLIASYLSYYVIKPGGRTNYGAFIDPRAYPIPALEGRALDGKPLELGAFDGKWIMLQVDSGNCDKACREKMYAMRQLRLTQGREMTRVERVWLVTDNQSVDPQLLREYDGTVVIRANANSVAKWLPVDTGGNVTNHLYMIDPLGNLMMRFPENPDLNKVKKDLARLLKASRIG